MERKDKFQWAEVLFLVLGCALLTGFGLRAFAAAGAIGIALILHDETNHD